MRMAAEGRRASRFQVLTCVVVICAVDEQQRLLDLVGILEGAHHSVRIRSLPQRALLRLEAKRRQRPRQHHNTVL